MGIGPEMRPRTLWWPVLGRAVVGEVGALPKILGFMVSLTETANLFLRAARGKLREAADAVMSMLESTGVVEVGDCPGGLSEPSGITTK